MPIAPAGSLDELAVRLGGIAARLREIGDEGLVRELSTAITRAVTPVPKAIRAGLPDHMPDRYAAVLDEDTQIGRSVSTALATARVSVYATNRTRRRRLRRLDGGVLWHLTFGDEPWREQGAPSVRPGWFDDPVLAAVPRVRDAVSRALDDVAEKAVRGA